MLGQHLVSFDFSSAQRARSGWSFACRLLARNGSEERLARGLLLLARFGKEDKPEEVVADISQETLAEMIGTTRSRVNFFMNKFGRLGCIDYNDRLRVHNSLLNVVLHE